MKKCCMLCLLGLILFGFSGLAAAGTFAYEIEAGASWAVTSTSRGQIVEMKGFSTGGIPGGPMLPSRAYNIALPPDVDLRTVDVKILSSQKRQLSGTFEIAPAVPLGASPYGKEIVSWGTATRVVGGRDLDVYCADALFPATPVTVVSGSQLRKWKFVRLVFSPFAYNPVQKILERISRVKLEISYEVLPAANISPGDVQDTIMDKRAGELFDNFDDALRWYAPETQNGTSMLEGCYDEGYVIITTKEIQANLAKLSGFVAHLAGLGFTPRVVDESEWGCVTGADLPGGAANKIRKWLQDNYLSLNVKYVLLIGNPDPGIGDVPMLTCNPLEETPTDYYFADLTGDWDLDDDQVFGEYPDDCGLGGVDFAADVYVGRIPLYDGAYAACDAVLQRTIDYAAEPPGERGWRKKMLLPMAISNYANEDGRGWEAVTGPRCPHYTVEEILAPAGYEHWVCYEKEGLTPPVSAADDYDCGVGINMESVVTEWNKGYGCVFWWGHGSETGVYRKFWDEDVDADGVPDGREMAWTSFMDTSGTTTLTSRPSVVFQTSCLNGYPETADNLGARLLMDQAVGTVSASRVSWYAVAPWRPTFNPDNVNVGYRFFQHLIAAEKSTGEALYDAAGGAWDFWWGGASRMNLMDFNLYGCPHVHLGAGEEAGGGVDYMPIIKTLLFDQGM